MKEEIKTKGFKGFNKDLKCRDFQYKEGETYETDNKPVRCTENGFHFCTEPLDILAYYNPADSVFHHVEGIGEISADESDSKIAVSKIKIGAQIGISEFVKLSFEAILKRCKNKIKENSGDSSMASNSGYRGAAFSIGDYSSAETTHENSFACSLGYEGKSKGVINSWITLAEYGDDYNIKCVKTAKIDGVKLKADTFYKLLEGKFLIA